MDELLEEIDEEDETEDFCRRHGILPNILRCHPAFLSAASLEFLPRPRFRRPDDPGSVNRAALSSEEERR